MFNILCVRACYGCCSQQWARSIGLAVGPANRELRAAAVLRLALRGSPVSGGLLHRDLLMLAITASRHSNSWPIRKPRMKDALAGAARPRRPGTWRENLRRLRKRPDAR